MDTKNKALAEVLARHGVSDANAVLDAAENAGIRRSGDPDVRMRGSVQMMKERRSTRESRQKGFAKLKHL